MFWYTDIANSLNSTENEGNSDFQTKFTPEMNQSILKSPIPPAHTLGIWLERCSLLWGIWPKMRPAQSDIWLSLVSIRWSALQAKGFRYSFPIEHMCRFHRLLLLYSQFCWNIQEPLKKPVNLGFLGWKILLKWTNLRKTAFPYFDISVVLSRILHLNKRFDTKFLLAWVFDSFWSDCRCAFEHLNCQHTGEFHQNC